MVSIHIYLCFIDLENKCCLKLYNNLSFSEKQQISEFLNIFLYFIKLKKIYKLNKTKCLQRECSEFIYAIYKCTAFVNLQK